MIRKSGGSPKSRKASEKTICELSKRRIPFSTYFERSLSMMNSQFVRTPLISVAISLLLLLPSIAFSADIIEDFSDGSVTDGLPVTWELDDPQGSGEIVGNAFRLDGSAGECCASIRTQVDEYADVSIEIEVEFLSTRNMFSGVGFRNPGGYWAGVQRDGELGIGFWNSTEITKRGVFLPPESLAEGLITYRVDAIGDEISLSAWKTGDGIETATVLNWTDPDNLYPTGNAIAPFFNPYDDSSNNLDVHSIQFTTQPVPEPCAVYPSILGALGVSCLRRRRKA